MKYIDKISHNIIIQTLASTLARLFYITTSDKIIIKILIFTYIYLLCRILLQIFHKFDIFKRKEYIIMIYVPISNLKPGMKLSADISINGCNYSDAYLLKKKKMLTSNLIDKLKLFNIHGVYIEDGIKNKIEIKRLVDDSLKDEAVSAVKDIFTVCETQKKI